jgi:hypothetical protein
MVRTNFFPSHFLRLTLSHSSVFLSIPLEFCIDLPSFRLCWKVTQETLFLGMFGPHLQEMRRFEHETCAGNL